jgi:hypothetical protein
MNLKTPCDAVSIRNRPLRLLSAISTMLVFAAHLGLGSLPAEALEPASFDPAPAGTASVWDDLNSSDSGRSIIRDNDGYEVRWSWKGEPREGYIFCPYCGSTRFDVDDYAALWPLEVGKSVEFWRYSHSNNGRKWKDTIRVVGTETVELESGPVETFKVVNESRAYSHSWSGTFTYWYAPSIGWTVKQVGEPSDSDGWTWQARSFDSAE